MFPLLLSGRALTRPSLALFIGLQILDVLTTMIGLKLGAREGSFVIGQLMRLGPLTGLLISKILAVFLAALAMKFRRPRVIVTLNSWFAILIAWNLLVIVLAGLGVTA